jgi:hypothetical protein
MLVNRYRLASLLILLVALLAVLAGSALAAGTTHASRLGRPVPAARAARAACRSRRHETRAVARCADARRASRHEASHRVPVVHRSQPTETAHSEKTGSSGSAGQEGSAQSPAPSSPAPSGEGSGSEGSTSSGSSGGGPTLSAPVKEETAPAKAPVKEETSGTPSSAAAVVNVNATPTGPGAPAGGWHVAFADGFGAQLGTGPGQDNFWFANRGCCNDNPAKDFDGDNTNELEAYNSSQVSVNSNGLQLTDTYAPSREPAEGSYPVRNYVSGTVRTMPVAGYQPFTWKPGGGETWAFECVCKMPPYFQGLDVGWWTTDKAWSDEVDFFESWTESEPKASEALLGSAWIYETQPLHSVESWTSLWRRFDPSAAFHRYTTVITPNDTIEQYIDGVHVYSYGPPSHLAAEPQMFLILTNAIRSDGGSDPDAQFTSGSRAFQIRSIAVYEDGNHAGQGVTGGGVAPGTTVLG